MAGGLFFPGFPAIVGYVVSNPRESCEKISEGGVLQNASREESEERISAAFKNR